MTFKEKVGNHLFYSSTDTNFCKAKIITKKQKITKKQLIDPLTIYRKKLKKQLK
jgi:hypothetical protein